MPEDNEGRFYWLLDRIVRREGIGDVLADGTYWAAERIGKGAQEYAHNNIKKTEQLPLKLGMLNQMYFLMYCTGEKANITQIEGNFPQAPFPTREEREEFTRTGPRSRTSASRSGSRTGSSAETTRFPTIHPPRRAARSSTGRRRCTTSTTAPGCAPGCRPFPTSRRSTSTTCPELISAGAGLDLDEGVPEAHHQAEPATWSGPSTSAGACGGRTRSRRRITGSGGSPSSREAAGPTTSSRGGIARACPLARPCTNWIWTTWPRISRAGNPERRRKDRGGLTEAAERRWES